MAQVQTRPGPQRPGQIDSKPDEGPSVQNPPLDPEAPPALPAAVEGKYRVLVGVLSISEDVDGKKVKQVQRGRAVIITDAEKAETLLAQRAIEPWGLRADSIGPTNARTLSMAANALAQETDPEFLDDGTPEDVVNEGDA